MANTRDYMDYLDEHIEIAPANSQEEYQAAETIAEVLRDHELETTIEEFDAYPLGTLVGPILACVLFMCLLVAGLTGGAVRIIMILLAAAAVGLPLFVHFSGMNLLDNLGPASQSQNVVAVHRATGDKVVKGARPIVVVAHYDTPRESILHKTPIARYQATVRAATVPCMMAAAVSLFFQILVFLPGVIRTFMWVIGLIATLPLLVLGIIDIIDHFSACTTGANDNKSSVAALLAIANKVRPTGDRVDDDFEEKEHKPARRRLTDKPQEPAEPRRVEIIEEVKGVRHGAEVLSALGILPPTCEIVYQEPRVQIIEQAPTDVPTSDVAEELPHEAEEPADAKQTNAHEVETLVDSPRTNADEELDQDSPDTTEGEAYETYDEVAVDDEEGYDDEDYEEEDYDEEDYDEEDYDEEDYDEEDYDEEDEWESSGTLASVGAWFSERIAGIREYFSKDRGSDVDIDRGEDRRDTSDEPDEYDIWIDEYEDDADVDVSIADEEEADEEEYLDDEFADLDEDIDDDTYEDVSEELEEDEDLVDELDIEDEDYFEDEENQDVDAYEEDVYEEDGSDEELDDESYGDFEYDEYDTDEVEGDFEGEYEDEYEDEYEEHETEDDAPTTPSLLDRIRGFFHRTNTPSAADDDSPEWEYEEEDDGEYDDSYEEYEETEDDLYEDDLYEEDLEESYEDAYDDAEEDNVYVTDGERFEDVDEPYEDSDEQVYEGEFVDADLEFEDEIVYDAEPEEEPEPLTDPNLLHFDREEDADIAPRDTTGLDTISDSYDLYTGEVNRTSERTRPEPLDDPSWGVSSYQPAQPVMNIARRAALFDLPDPSLESMDPFADDEYDEYEDEDAPAPEEYATDVYEDEPESFDELVFDVLDDVEEESVSEEHVAEGSNDEGDAEHTQTKFWGSSQSSDWKGGATSRADLRVDDDDPIIIDADDLQDAILEMGDDFLVAHDIWFVATGASEVNHAGMRAFIDEHRRDIRGAFLVNLDSIGAGSLSVLVREGLHAPRRADRRLVRMITGIAQDLHIQLETAVYGWDERESATSMRSRVRSVTIAGLDDNDLPALSHTPDDVPDNVDPEQVSNVVRIVTEMIRRS